jgi:hypothetical protein
MYDLLGGVDEVVVYSQGPDGEAATSLSTKIDATALTTVEQAVRGDPAVVGVMPMLTRRRGNPSRASCSPGSTRAASTPSAV